MLEFIILWVIALGVDYWATLWLMGRRDDVLHGHFVRTDARVKVLSQPLPAANVARADRLLVLDPHGEEHSKAVRLEP